MAKASVPASHPVKAAKRTVTVIYRPLEHVLMIPDKSGKLHPGGISYDPPKIKWNGITFNANVPVELDPANPDHHIVQLLPKTFPGANGEVLTKHVESKVFMGETAKGNPSFEVDGVRAKRKINTRVVPPPGAEWTEAHEGQVSNSDEIDTSVAA